MSYEIIELLNEINRQGTTILVVTHEHDLVRHFHKRVVELDKGRVVGDSAANDDVTEGDLLIRHEDLLLDESLR